MPTCILQVLIFEITYYNDTKLTWIIFESINILRECLKNHINYSDDPDVKCPYSKDYNCSYYLQDREIRALLNNDDYSKYQM